MRRFRGRDFGLGLLVILVNVALVVAVVSVTTGHPDVTASAASSSVAPSPEPTPAPSTSSPAPTPTPTPTVDVAELLAGDDDVEIVVLGDQTGDGEGEWVAVMSGLLGADHRVTLHLPDPQDPTVYSGERVFGESGSDVDVYNGCRAGTEASYAASRLDALAPDAPDAVVLDYGRNDSSSSLRKAYGEILDQVRSRWPEAAVYATLQPQVPGDEQKRVRTATRKWARSEGVRLLDVEAEFTATGSPEGFVSPFDPTATTPSGDELWGRTAFAVLTDAPLPVTEAESDPGGSSSPDTSDSA